MESTPAASALGGAAHVAGLVALMRGVFLVSLPPTARRVATPRAEAARSSCLRRP